MANTGALKQGQKLEAIYGPLDREGDQQGGTVGLRGVIEIEVGQCPGPMAWYDVAIIRYEHKPTEIMPVHMAEYIRLLKQS